VLHAAVVFKRGYLKVGTWQGVPIRFHWSTPFGALLLSGFRFAPAYWAGFIGLVLIHELGHAVVVKRVQAKVLSVDVMAMGGLCRWEGQASPIQRACIAWGGIWAQLVLLAVAYAVLAIGGEPRTNAGSELANLCTHGNLWMMGFNLLPIPPLDGSQTWQLFPLLFQKFAQRQRLNRYIRADEATRKKLEELDDREVTDNPPPEVKALVSKLLEDAKKRE
jgi:stage IV sporulation protein FB